MGTQKRSKTVPAKARKAGGVRQNQHRFEGFHERAARLTINPAQRARQSDERTTESYLKARLEFWKETNLSKNFVEFTREFEPLCDSLVQILHNEQSIFDLLKAYIERKDEHSLEALLDLLSQLAHDLGFRFEKFFAPSLLILVDIVSGHQQIEVIEWSFNTLAWLFQYLSKLLAPDLRLTYDALTPLLGKKVRKEHVARFAAEAMSFLLRKAASKYNSNQSPLTLIVKHMLQDWSTTAKDRTDEDVYGYGLMTLLADAIKDLKSTHGIRPHGLPVYKTLLAESIKIGDVEIASGVTTCLIHHTQTSTFVDIQVAALEQINDLKDSASNDSVFQACEVLFTLVAVRKGNRISDWPAVFDSWYHLLEILLPRSKAGSIYSSFPTVLAATIIQTASFESLTSRLDAFIDSISGNDDLFDFPLFCVHSWKLREDRFHELLKPYMFRYMAENWAMSNVRLILASQAIFTASSGSSHTSSSSNKRSLIKWSKRVVRDFSQWSQDPDAIFQYDAALDLAQVLEIDSHQDWHEVTARLQDLVTKGSQSELPASSEIQRFTFGGFMSWYLMQKFDKDLGSQLTWQRLASVRQDLGSMAHYLDNLSMVLDHGVTKSHVESDMSQILIRNLATGSNALRLASLHLLNKLHCNITGSDASVLVSALSIENTPADHQSLRVLSMHVARLPVEYMTQKDHPWLGKAIVNYLYGALTIQLRPLWADIAGALKQIYDSNQGDGVQLLEDICFQWIETRHPKKANGDVSDHHEPANGPTNEFQCTNARKWRADSENSQLDLSQSDERLRVRFNKRHLQVPNVPEDSVEKALIILAAIPVLAERRSRRLVPQFLKWASADDDSEATLLGDASPDHDSEGQSSGLSRKEQKAMLDIFGNFQNPNVLHQASEVYNALLRLLGNGDVEIQKAALKALAAWKQPAIKRYQEELNNLLDNARFREELVIFLPSQTAENGLPPVQRQELIRVLLRLLYGRIIARGSAAAGRASQTARRKAVFESLANFPQDDLTSFMDVILGPLRNLVVKSESIVPEDHTGPVPFPLRKQLGLTRLVGDLLESIGDKTEHLAPTILMALLFCLSNVRSVKQDPLEGPGGDETISSMTSLQKAVRQGALQALIKLFEVFRSFDVQNYANLIVSVAISPRLGPRFASENGQSISSTLQLLAVWASRPDLKRLFFENSELLPNVLACLDFSTDSSEAKPEVKVFVMDKILRPLIQDLSVGLEERLSASGFYEKLLVKTAKILEHGGSKDLLATAVSTILQVANNHHTEARQQATTPWSASVSLQLVKVFQTLLDLPTQVVNAVTKTSALVVLARFLPSVAAAESTDVLLNLYQSLSKLFASARGSEMRDSLCEAFSAAAALLGGRSPEIAALCKQLNAFSVDRLDEPDYDKRYPAYDAISMADSLDDYGWMPLVYNGLFFIREHEDQGIQNGATRILKRFIDTNLSTEATASVVYPTSRLMRGVLLPALRRGASERAEVVRVEYVNVMAHLVTRCSQWSEVKDLTILASSSDESESFFDGVLHIQQDWRKRSLIKLARLCRQGHLSSNSIAHYLLPLVQQFVFDRAEDDDAHSLSAQSVMTIGAMISSLDWTQTRKTLRHYSNVIKDKPELEKAVIRLIGVTTEAIHASMADETSTIRSTTPPAQDLATDIENVLLPPLVNFLHHKDENVVSLRVPIAVSAARLVCLLPETALEYRLAPVLTDVCNILRSKAQESRDLSRKTLSEIAALIGPRRFSFILKELRIALSRGYQLHVLAYTVHSLLVVSDFKPGDLDYCLPQIMRVILDDTLGSTGKEKDADGYTNKAKEVKGSKSMDTAERVAKITTVEHLKEFILPVHQLLVERLDARAINKIDELLRRLRSGLEQNVSIGNQKTLVFCFEVLQQSKTSARTFVANARQLTRKEQQQKETFEIRTKGAKKAPALPQVSSQQYKLARFSLDLLREVLRRHEHLRTPAGISGFLTPVGDVLLDAQEEVQISALRFLASIMKVPMTELQQNAPVYADTAYKALRNQPDTNTELSQAAIKLLTSMIRDRPEVSLKDSQLSWLIKAAIPDLTQPSAQGVTFNFLKAIIQRKIVINEIYEAMDALAKLFITYSDNSARSQARSIWLQFVTTYEQSEKRFIQQLAFLTKNLEYKHSEGRQSVMEAIHVLLGKLDHEHLQRAVLSLFVPVMSRFIGDEVASCRDMAGLLLKAIVAKADDDGLQTIRKALQNYLGRDDKPALQTASMRVYASFVEVDPERASKDYPILLDRLRTILSETSGGDNSDWELPYYALQLVAVLGEASEANEAYNPKISSPKLQSLWSNVYEFAAYPHAWVKHAAAKLMRTLFSGLVETTNTEPKMLHTSSGLSIDHHEVCNLVRSYFRTMLRSDVQDWLVVELTQNLETLSRTVGDLIMTAQGAVDGDEASGDDVDVEMDGNELAGDDKTRVTRTVREYSLGQISTIIRRDSPLIAKRAALDLLAIMTDRMPAAHLLQAKKDILMPLIHLIDPNITKKILADETSNALQQELCDKARDIDSGLQRKLSDGRYTRAMYEVQQEIRQKRDDRLQKRRIEVVTDPGADGEYRARKRARAHDGRKARNSMHRARRLGY